MKKTLLSIAVLFASQMLHAQLTIYSDLNLQGTSGTCVSRTIYTGTNIPNGLNDGIMSITLAQGFMATIAENTDGSGERFTYMATKSTLSVNLAFVLQNKVSFIRVLKLPTVPVKKKGSANTDNAITNALNVTWYYDWGYKDYSTTTREYVPMSWNGNGATDVNLNPVIQRDSLTHYLTFNEPDNDGQANMYVSAAIPAYKKLLRAGQRMASPACTESQYRVWLDSFATVANDQMLKIDVICVHWYDWGNYLSTLNVNPTGTEVFNRFKSYIDAVYDRFKKPIWITEFNANVNRPAAVHEAFMRLALPWLDSDPRIERYSYFFGNDLPARNTNGTLTTGGQIYADHVSVEAYPDNIYDTRPASPIELASWDPSTFTQGGLSVATFAPTTLNTNMTAPLAITRGSGIDLPFSTSSNGYWGATNFSTTTAATGVSASKFFRFSLKSKNNKAVNYHSIDKLNIRISSTGPIQYQIDYQLNSGSFYPCATITGPARTTGNYLLGPIDLSAIAGLQDVPATSTITFRITPFDASSTGGSFFIGSGTTDTDPDLVITGGFSDANLITNTLPVTLASFQLKRNNSNTVLLQWATQSEVNFSHFELERSNDATTFTTLATIAGINQLNGSNYSYTDISIANATKYYRLKMIDKNGSINYSNVLTDAYNNVEIPLLVYPTVSSGSAVRATFKTVTKATQLHVVSESGKVVGMYTIQSGTNSQIIQTQSLAKGIYFIKLIDSEKAQSSILIKQ